MYVYALLINEVDLYFFFLHISQGIFMMPWLLAAGEESAFISLPLSFRCYCTLSNRLKEQQQQSVYAKHTLAYYTPAVSDSQRKREHLIKPVIHANVSTAPAAAYLCEGRKGRNLFFFFSREGGREGGAIWSRNCVKSYCTSTHWQKLKVDFLPTSGGDGDTHTEREREGKLLLLLLLLLLRLSRGRDLLVRSELVRPAVETLCFLPVLRTVTYTTGVWSEGRTALVFFCLFVCFFV